VLALDALERLDPELGQPAVDIGRGDARWALVGG
jgi:hypothetical protein